MKDTMIGVDLAKNVFQLHGASMMGELKFRRKLSRAGFIRLMEEHEPAIVVMEACGGANFWARELVRFGHEPSSFRSAFRKRVRMSASAYMQAQYL